MYNNRLSLDEAVDAIMNEEASLAGRVVNEGCCGKSKKKQKKGKKQCEEDAEETDFYRSAIRSITSQNPNGLSVRDILTYFEQGQERDVMRTIQLMANDNEVKLDGSMVKPEMVTEGSLFDYANKSDKECCPECGEEECCCDKEMDNRGCVKQQAKSCEDAEETEPKQSNNKKYSVKDAVCDYFEQSVSGSVSGVKLGKAVKDLMSRTKKGKPEVVAIIKKMLANKTLTKGPSGDTLIYNSSKDKNNKPEEDDEIPTGLPKPANNASASYGNTQPLSNKDTPETLKAKGWKDNGNGLFVSPDGKQQFLFTTESNQLNSTYMTNNYDFDLLVEETEEALNNLGAEDNDTAGLDELQDIDDTDTTMEDDETVQVTLTKSEAQTLADILAKVQDVMDGGSDFDSEDDDDFVDDEATDEEANSDLMDDDDVSFEEEEDSEELAGTGNAGVYDGGFGNTGASMSKHNNNYGPNRRKPIEGRYRPTGHGQAYDGGFGNTGASMSKHNNNYGPDKRKPVPGRVTKNAGANKSIFED